MIREQIEAYSDIFSGFIGKRKRRSWNLNGRSYIELRSLSNGHYLEYVDQIKRRVKRLKGVETVQINSAMGRLVVQHDPKKCAIQKITDLCDSVETELELEDEPFSTNRVEHPGDQEPFYRLALEMGADSLSLVSSFILKLLRSTPLPIEVDFAAIVSLVENSPRLRELLEERFDPLDVDLGLNLTSSVAQALAQGPIGPAVDIVKRSLLLREHHSRQDCWKELEVELSKWSRKEIEPLERRERPVPFPLGPIETYSDKAWFASLGAFGLGMMTTKSFQKSTSALFGGLPKPALLGRESFSSNLTKILSDRKILTLDNSSLRLLDRINCIVIQGHLLQSGLNYIEDVISLKDDKLHVLKEKLEGLFNSENVQIVKRKQKWALGPIDKLNLKLSKVEKNRVSIYLRKHPHLIGLAYNGQLRALITISQVQDKEIDDFVKALRKAKMKFVVATNHPEYFSQFKIDKIIPDNASLVQEIRRLQRRGKAVALIAGENHEGFKAADVNIGLFRKSRKTPWHAHILCSHRLSDATFLVQACQAARRITNQSVQLSLTAASVGFLLSSRGLERETSGQVMSAVNVAALISIFNAIWEVSKLSQIEIAVDERIDAPWHEMELETVYQILGSRESGLNLAEVGQRVRPEKETPSMLSTLFRLVVDELNNPLTPVLAGGAGLSAVVGSLADASMVLTVLGLNGVIGAVQRFKSETAVFKLSDDHSFKIHVLRQGKEQVVSSHELVPGDVVHLHAGDVIPADCRIIKASTLEVDESNLTGESIPVLKNEAAVVAKHVGDRSSMLYQGTSIAAGDAKAVVVAIGDDTEANRALYLGSTPSSSGVEARLDQLASYTIPVTLFSGAAVVGAGMMRGQPLTDVLGTGVSLAVAAIPEGLPILATVAQLSAAKRLSTRGIIARNIRAIEGLGRVNVVCIDKTGTLTYGKIKLDRVSDGFTEEYLSALEGTHLEVLQVGYRACPVQKKKRKLPHMTDRALIDGAKELGLETSYEGHPWEPKSELPFGPQRMYHAVKGKLGKETWITVKGSPEVLIKKCSHYVKDGQAIKMSARMRARFLEHSLELAGQGLRILLVAERESNPRSKFSDSSIKELVFRGFVAFRDPIRESAVVAVDQMRKAGVDIVMVTGDHPSTAEQIAKELNILNGRGVITGAELDELSEKELVKRLPKISVFARVSPIHKAKIVQAYQAAGRHVAMTGDGSNDAAAIRLADVGIAVSKRSTPAAREAADLIVTDDRIETIIDAIIEGRALWSSVRDAVSILIGGNLGEIGFTVMVALLSRDVPLDARQLLLVNLITDIAPALVIASKAPKIENLENLLKEGPESSLGAALNEEIIWRALTTSAGAGSAWLLSRVLGSPEKARTVGLLALVGTQLAQTIFAGNGSKGVLAAGLSSFAGLGGIVQTPGVSQFFGCTPVGPLGWSIAMGTTLTSSVVSALTPKFFPNATKKIVNLKLTEKIVKQVTGTFKSNGRKGRHSNGLKGLLN